MQIPDFSRARILVIGDLMLDRYWNGSTGRISPEAPVPVVQVKDIEDRPGGAANVAVNAATLGAQVTLIGFVGNDESANILHSQLTARGVTPELIKVDGYDTITKLRVISRNQQLLRLDFEKSFELVDKQPLLNALTQKLDDIDVLILSDYAKGCLSNVQLLIEAARAKGVRIVIDPKGTDFSKYANATVITPNMSEFETAFGEVDKHLTSNLDVKSDEYEAALATQARRACNEWNVENLLLTRSEHGMTLFTQDAAYHSPALAKEVYDVTGAGDTVVSTLACSLAAGASIEQASQLANHAAGVVVGKLGTSTVTSTELALAVNSHKSIDGGIMSVAQLRIAVEQAKARGEKVVFTNGCFDILHAGHVSYLEHAAKLGERLIVAVNSDVSVTKLKGEGRPVNTCQRRMAVLAGLASVDWVVEFGEDTPLNVITAVMPDVLVKGGDYKIDEIVGAKEVFANGGEVKSLNFEDGVSTTAIIKQIIDTDKH